MGDVLSAVFPIQSGQPGKIENPDLFLEREHAASVVLPCST
jgi:hypothetical protein